MNILAFDTSTDVMSIAVGRSPGDATVAPQVWQHTGPGSAQASGTLIPVIQQLMAQAGLAWAQLDAIAFGRGPGSFTGLRTACSVAQGLAYGAGLKVLPVDSLLALAEEARWQRPQPEAPLKVQTLLDARMDEVYAASYEFDGQRWSHSAGYSLLAPQELVLPAGWALAGNAFAAYGERLPAGVVARITALPTATAMLRLAPQLMAEGLAVAAPDALPTYIRDKVAQTTRERSELKAARGAA